MVAFNIQAQVNIKGKVTFANEAEGAIGVNILLKEDNTVGTITDIDGSYSLTVPSKNSTLVFSYIGYNTTEIVVGDQTEINVSLSENASVLNEVVVTGYTNQKRSNISGSVATLNAKDISEKPILRVPDRWDVPESMSPPHTAGILPPSILAWCKNPCIPWYSQKAIVAPTSCKKRSEPKDCVGR